MKDYIMKKNYYYIAFGLKILSEIELPELMMINEDLNFDMKIICGKVPSIINDFVEKTEEYVISQKEFLFYIENIARYYIRDGQEIIIEACENADSEMIRVYLLSTAIGMLLMQRNMLAIHGGSVMIEGKCVIFTGACGAGKSTMCSFFRKAGNRYLSDDISVVTLGIDGQPYVQPAFPQQRLCTDTAIKLGYDTSMLKKACLKDDKFIIVDTKNYFNEPVPLAAIIEISPVEGSNIEVNRTLGAEKLKNIIKNIYCVILMSRIGIPQKYLIQCVSIVKNVEFYKLARPIGKNTIHEQSEIVNSIVLNKLIDLQMIDKEKKNEECLGKI
jgi:nucleoside phosphorylase